MKRKEILWLIGTAIFLLILMFYIFGFDGFKSESVTDINLHDTYFVIANIHLALFLSVLIFFIIYLVRVLRRNFKNLTANVIFMIAGIFNIWILTGMISIVNSYIGITETTEYNLLVTKNMFEYVSTILYLCQIITIGLIAYIGFKTGRYYKLNV